MIKPPHPLATPLTYRSASATHVGQVRENNQDNLLDIAGKTLWAVADGMGGHADGAQASALVIEALTELSFETEPDDTVNSVVTALEQLNTAMVTTESGRSPGRRPGSTVAVLCAQDNQLAVIWAGDSRVYRKRGDALDLMTRDHSHVQDLIDQERLDPKFAEDHPLANVITRAVGVQPGLQCEVHRSEVLPEDRYLICSDGLSRVLEHATLARLMEDPDINQSVTRLMDAVLYAGAPDNVTIVVVECSTGP